jgi:L-alanine-DL-glutamate epimerase-like enolase superfamily enzyme
VASDRSRAEAESLTAILIIDIDHFKANLAVRFCKEAEKFRMFFLEDPLSPEDNDYFRQIRA